MCQQAARIRRRRHLAIFDGMRVPVMAAVAVAAVMKVSSTHPVLYVGSKQCPDV